LKHIKSIVKHTSRHTETYQNTKKKESEMRAAVCILRSASTVCCLQSAVYSLLSAVYCLSHTVCYLLSVVCFGLSEFYCHDCTGQITFTLAEKFPPLLSAGNILSSWCHGLTGDHSRGLVLINRVTVSGSRREQTVDGK
jgi:hypothetical protein